MKKKKPRFNYRRCMACGMCVQACPVSCLSLELTGKDSYSNAFPVMIDEGKCISCGICARECPLAAITLAEGIHQVKG